MQSGMLKSSLSAAALVCLMEASALAQGAIAFAPGVSSVPSGVSLNVTPVVTADRRYVRLGGLNVGFQELLGVETFSFPGGAVGGGGIGGFGGGGFGGGGFGGLGGIGGFGNAGGGFGGFNNVGFPNYGGYGYVAPNYGGFGYGGFGYGAGLPNFGGYGYTGYGFGLPNYGYGNVVTTYPVYYPPESFHGNYGFNPYVPNAYNSTGYLPISETAVMGPGNDRLVARQQMLTQMGYRPNLAYTNGAGYFEGAIIMRPNPFSPTAYNSINMLIPMSNMIQSTILDRPRGRR